jgi:hypothetical protein
MKIRHHLALRQLSSVRRQLEERASSQELVRFLWAVTKHTHGLRNWKHLTPEEKIARVKTHNAAGLLGGPNVPFYVVAALVTDVAILRVEQTYEQHFAARFDAIDRRHGLDVDGGETWLVGEEPDDHRALAREFDAAADPVVLETYRQFDEPMGDLYARDRAVFNARFDAGRILVQQSRVVRDVSSPIGGFPRQPRP